MSVAVCQSRTCRISVGSVLAAALASLGLWAALASWTGQVSVPAGREAISEGGGGAVVVAPFDFEAGLILPSTEGAIEGFVDPFAVLSGPELSTGVIEPFDFEAGLILPSAEESLPLYVDPLDLEAIFGVALVPVVPHEFEEDVSATLGDLGTAATPGGSVGVDTGGSIQDPLMVGELGMPAESMGAEDYLIPFY